MCAVSLKTRVPVCAGLFYPASPGELRQTIRTLLDSAVQPAGPLSRLKALISPHAGYVYSGPIAASGYACLKEFAGSVRRVVLIGPSHRVPVQNLAAPSAEVFATPLGPVRVDTDAIRRATQGPNVCILDQAHTNEHALEVQLPFLQVLLGDFSIVPLVFGNCDPSAICDVLESLWGGPETLIVVSSDLSHYYDHAAAHRLDRATADHIEKLEPEKIEEKHACGQAGIAALLVCAKRHALRPLTVDLRNSGDTAGPRERVVGYGAFAFC
jgi:AmmeMemoRadiSam system protein B